MYTSQKGKVLHFGHLCQLLLHAVILSKRKCICRSWVSATGLKSDKLGTADRALSTLCLPGPLNIRIFGVLFWYIWLLPDSSNSLKSGLLTYSYLLILLPLFFKVPASIQAKRKGRLQFVLSFFLAFQNWVQRSPPHCFLYYSEQTCHAKVVT